jgi:hypothetical protein
MVISSFKEGIKELLLLLANCDCFLAVMCSGALLFSVHGEVVRYLSREIHYTYLRLFHDIPD